MKGELPHQHLKPAFSFGIGELQQILHELEHRHDVVALPQGAVKLLGRQKLRQQQDHGGEQPLRTCIHKRKKPW